MTVTVKDPMTDPKFDFVTGRPQEKNLDHDGQMGGAGASDNFAALPNTAGSAFSYYLESAATTGTVRGKYMKVKLSGGAGGEAGRYFTQVENNAPADTVNGTHNSLGFGASAGNITGEGNASRNTLHLPTGRTIGGTVSAVKGEAYADGAAPAVSNAALFRGVIAGDATGVGVLDDNVALIGIDGGTNGSGNMVSAVGSEPTWTSNTHKIRIKVNGVAMYLIATLS